MSTDADPAEPEYLKPAEAARMLHISPRTIDRWADHGYLPCLVTLGGHRRFPRHAILAVAEKMAERAPPSGEGGTSNHPGPKRASTG